MTPGVLICSGLDPSGGAGFVADVAVARMLGVRPVGVVTALTVQSTGGVTGCEPVSADVLRDQLELLLGDVEVFAVKIGMIATAASAVAIGEALRMTNAPVVWDPILAPTLGRAELAPLAEVYAALAPHLALITPNAAELAVLGAPERLGCAVLVKGGHAGGDASDDRLFVDGRVETLSATRIPHGEAVHGTGCALATAIAAHLARGADMLEACRAAKRFVAERIANPVRPGRGAPSVL